MTVVIGAQKLLHNKRHVSQSVMMQGPGVAPLVWTFALDVFPQSPENVAMNFPFTVCPGGTNSLCTMPSL